VVSFLFSAEARQPENAELLYILYLYVARLDKENLSAPSLLHSVNLKDHPDIKIRKEVLSQLEKFEKASESQLKGLLMPFLESLRLLFLTEKNPIFDLFTNNDATVGKCLAYNTNYSQHAGPVVIDKLLDLSTYALKFYKLDQSN
jgi:hypothetical protein